MPVRPDFTGVIKPKDLDQLFVTGGGAGEALLAHEPPTLQPCFRRLLCQCIRDFMNRVVGPVAAKELRRKWSWSSPADPPVCEDLNGDAEGWGDFTNGHGMPRGSLVICHWAASTSARFHSEARG
jgi:hypothetical protein